MFHKNNRCFLFFSCILSLAMAVAGCGGGGGRGASTQPASQQAAAGNYSSRPLASGWVGPSPVVLQATGISFTGSLAATTTVSLNERFYLGSRPTGLVGAVYDIHPDGLDFSAAPATLCISTGCAGISASDLQIFTGAALDEPLDSYADNSGRVCALLRHTSPYGLRHAEALTAKPSFTIFGNLHTKENGYYYKTEITNGSDTVEGPWTKYWVHVECNALCMEEGNRGFKFITSGAHRGDLLIEENGMYPLWRDYGNMKWSHLYSSGGGVEGGIAYLLAAHFVEYFFGGGPVGAYYPVLEPPENNIQKFLRVNTNNSAPDTFISVARESGNVTIHVRDDSPERTFTIVESTAAVTRSQVQGGTLKTLAVKPADAAYTAVRDELVQVMNLVLGFDDTPDGVAGNAYDGYARMTPNQELFAINVKDLINGFGWNNLEYIEFYYRDRLDRMPPGLQ